MIYMVEKQLPPSFHELESFVGWALATERGRTARRQSSTIAEIKSFYDAMVTRLQEILDYLDGFTLDNTPEDVRRLFLLTMSLAEVAPAVENFGQPSVIDGYDFSRFIPVHD
jgi:hypothetical protein